MKDKKNKVKEPFEPKDTPKPPQVIEPDHSRKRENAVSDDQRPENNAKTNDPAHSERQHLLADDAEIEDETTI